jgi:hypothetical protein
MDLGEEGRFGRFKLVELKPGIITSKSHGLEINPWISMFNGGQQNP